MNYRMFVSAGLFALLTVSSFFVTADAKIIIGHVQDERFHPVLVVTEGELQGEGDFRELAFPTVVFPIVVSEESDSLKLGIPVEQRQIIGPDRIMRFAPVVSPNTRNLFYSNHKDFKFGDPTNEFDEFFSFFSSDRWGRHFFLGGLEGAKKLIHPVGISDLDRDRLCEIWLSYKLSHGEIGTMVYEQRLDGNWDSISNQCFECD